jgi:hypothetical protein
VQVPQCVAKSGLHAAESFKSLKGDTIFVKAFDTFICVNVYALRWNGISWSTGPVLVIDDGRIAVHLFSERWGQCEPAGLREQCCIFKDTPFVQPKPISFVL